MHRILLSVKPEFANRILDGTKKFEYRTRLAGRQVGAIVLYATKPLIQVVGEAEVLERLSGSPIALWEATGEDSGTNRAEFMEYFGGCRTAHAYRLGRVSRYDKPKSLAELGVRQPPRSFVYLQDGV